MMLLIVFFYKCIPLLISCLLWNAHVFMSSMRIVWNVSVVSSCEFLDACTWRQNGGSLRAEVTCAKPMRVATSSLENALLLPLSLFAAPVATAPVIVGVRVCTAASMLWLMIVPMSSAVGCCSCAGWYVGPRSSLKMSPWLYQDVAPSSRRSHQHPQCTPVLPLGWGCWLHPLLLERRIIANPGLIASCHCCPTPFCLSH